MIVLLGCLWLASLITVATSSPNKNYPCSLNFTAHLPTSHYISKLKEGVVLDVFSVISNPNEFPYIANGEIWLNFLARRAAADHEYYHDGLRRADSVRPGGVLCAGRRGARLPQRQQQQQLRTGRYISR